MFDHKLTSSKDAFPYGFPPDQFYHQEIHIQLPISVILTAVPTRLTCTPPYKGVPERQLPMSTTRRSRLAREYSEYERVCFIHIPVEVPAIVCSMATAIGALSSFGLLFTTLSADSNPLPSDQDRASTVVILVLHILLGLAVFIGVVGLSQKRLDFALFYCALLYTDMLVNIVAGFRVVRHIIHAAGAEGPNMAHRDVKSLIQIYWILEFFTALFYTLSVAQLWIVRRRERARQNTGVESASLCRLSLVKWTTKTATMFEIVLDGPRWVRQIYNERKGRRSAGTSNADGSVATITFPSQRGSLTRKTSRQSESSNVTVLFAASSETLTEHAKESKKENHVGLDV